MTRTASIARWLAGQCRCRGRRARRDKALPARSDGGAIPNFEGDTDAAAARDLYGDHYDRLQAVKRDYDPGGRFVGGRVTVGEQKD